MILYVLRKEGNTSFQRLMNITHLSQARLKSNLSLLISEDIVAESIQNIVYTGIYVVFDIFYMGICGKHKVT